MVKKARMMVVTMTALGAAFIGSTTGGAMPTPVHGGATAGPAHASVPAEVLNHPRWP